MAGARPDVLDHAERHRDVEDVVGERQLGDVADDEAVDLPIGSAQCSATARMSIPYRAMTVARGGDRGDPESASGVQYRCSWSSCAAGRTVEAGQPRAQVHVIHAVAARFLDVRAVAAGRLDRQDGAARVRQLEVVVGAAFELVTVRALRSVVERQRGVIERARQDCVQPVDRHRRNVPRRRHPAGREARLSPNPRATAGRFGRHRCVAPIRPPAAGPTPGPTVPPTTTNQN